MPQDLQPTTARIKTSTLNKYVQREIDLIYTRSPLLGVLRAHKRITFNNSGREIHWFPRFRKRELETGLGEQVSVTFIATNTRLEARLAWRHYHMTERISRFERLVNKGPVALARIVERVTRELLSDMENNFRAKLYADANSNSLDIAGLQTFTAMKTTSYYLSSNGTRTPALHPASNLVYAGIGVEFGALGGNWSKDSGETIFPLFGSNPAECTPEFCAFTPLLIGSKAYFWTGQSQAGSWPGYWQQQLRFVRTYLAMLHDITPSVCVCNPEMLRTALDTLHDKQEIQVTAKSPVVDLGIKTLNFEGMELVADSACPTGNVFIFDPSYLELACLTGQLFERTQDDDITTQTELIRLDFDGQLVTYSPAVVGRIFGNV